MCHDLLLVTILAQAMQGLINGLHDAYSIVPNAWL